MKELGLGAYNSLLRDEKRRENLRSRMSKPKRIQRRAKGWKMPANAIPMRD
jgi:hypothetical protein